MDKATITTLAKMYDNRETLQRCKEYSMAPHFWMQIVDEAFGGTGTRSSVANAVDGKANMIAILTRAVVDDIERRMKDFDRQIEELGGEP